MFRSSRYFIEQLFINLSRHGLMSVATVSTAIISLVTLGMFMLVMMNIRSSADQISSQFEIFAFWDYRIGTDPGDIDAAIADGQKLSIQQLSTEEQKWANLISEYIVSRITAIRCKPVGAEFNPDVKNTVACVSEVKYLNKTQGLLKLQKHLGLSDEDLKDYIVYNVFPGKFEVRVSRSEYAWQVREFLRRMRISRDEIKRLFPRLSDAGVSDIYSRIAVYLDVPPIRMDLVEKIDNLQRIIGISGMALVVLMGIAMLYTIINTIRLTVLARKDDIRIMELMGGTQWFIRWPFILEGIFHGLIGSLVALAFLCLSYAIMYQLIRGKVLFFYLIEPRKAFTWLAVLLPLFGIAIGIVGSFISVERFFETSEANDRTCLRIRGR